jgi:uncharacterized membrane protein YcaP (DUF421 family)
MSPDWSGIFGLSVSPWELVIRGSAMYLFLFVIFRVVVRRRIGAVGMADILVLVIIADAAQNGMAGEYRSVTDGAILIGTIIAWNWLIDWANYRVPALQKWLEAPPLLLVDDGRILHRNLRHEFVTEEELRSKLREKGIDDLRQVAKAHMEADGSVSVIRRQHAQLGSLNSGTEP